MGRKMLTLFKNDKIKYILGVVVLVSVVVNFNGIFTTKAKILN